MSKKNIKTIEDLRKVEEKLGPLVKEFRKYKGEEVIVKKGHSAGKIAIIKNVYCDGKLIRFTAHVKNLDVDDPYGFLVLSKNGFKFVKPELNGKKGSSKTRPKAELKALNATLKIMKAGIKTAISGKEKLGTGFINDSIQEIKKSLEAIDEFQSSLTKKEVKD